MHLCHLQRRLAVALRSIRNQEDIEMFRSFKTASKPKLPILMSKAERLCFETYLDKVSSYFEFGCGGSTTLANAKDTVRRVTSVDSDREWAEKVSLLLPKVTMYWCDVGPTGEFGKPVDPSLKLGWPRYPEIWTREKESHEMVFIDGRFRVACLLYICLNPRGVKYILFDDFKDRPHYHCIMPFIDVLEIADSVLVCKPSDEFDREKCQRMYDQYKYNPE